MIARDLSPLFGFSAMAFVGASDSSHFGLGAYRAMKDVGYTGDYFPVNPNRAIVHEVPAYPSISAIPKRIDCAVIAVRREAVIPAFMEAVAQGARAVVVLSGNFAEADAKGAHLQQQLRDLARAHDVILIGPNCMGAASVRQRCALYQGRGLSEAITGGVSVVSQSGGLMNELLHYGNARGLGFCHLVSSGNEADVSCADIIDFYVRDEDTKVIVAIVETVREPELFVAALTQAAGSSKPVIVLKLGSSSKGAASALTHTGAMAGNDAVWSALLDQKAAVRARDIDEIVDLASVFSHIGSILRRRPLERAAVIEISGGSCELVCDLAEAGGLALPEVQAETAMGIKPHLQGFLGVANPLDTGLLWANPAMGDIYPPALAAFAGQPDMDIIASRFIVPTDTGLGGLNDRLAELDVARRAHPDRLFVVLSPTSNHYHAEWKSALIRYSLPFVPGFARAISALGKLATYSRRIRAWERPAVQAMGRPVEPETASTHTLNEVESKRLLGAAGLVTVPTFLTSSAEEAVCLAAELGYPAAAKLISRQITHKSDVGGVRLNIRTDEELIAAFDHFKCVTNSIQGAKFEGMSVQSMAPEGLELVLGAHRDAQFGPVIMFGLGGIFVETLADMILRVAPLSARDAHSMLDGIRAAKVLQGVRGRAPVNRPAIVDALVKLSTLMIERPDVDSIDINPAFANAEGLVAADARVVLRVPLNAPSASQQELRR
jgi:acetate---CoA ligase (ADP-forming)